MATSQPSNPSGPSPRDLAESIKQLIEDQGDYNNLLKNALKDANKMDAVYKRIQARIESMSRDSINTKRLNSELYNLKQKEYIARKNTADLEKHISSETKKAIQDEKDLKDKLNASNLTALQKIKTQNDLKLTQARLAANAEYRALEAAKAGIKIAEEETKLGEKAVENEKIVAKQMGISGNLAKMFADKLGVGEEVYSAMTLKARKLVDENGKLTNAGKWKVFATGIKATFASIKENMFDPAIMAAALVAGIVKAKNAIKNAISGTFNAAMSGMKGLTPEGGGVVSGLTSGISSMAKNIPFVGGLIGGLVDGFSALLDLVVGIDDAIVKAGRNLGMTSDQARQLNRHFQDISFNQGNVFVTSKKLLESYSELAGQLEVNNQLSDEALQTNIMLKDFAGLELDTRGKIAEVGKITGKSSEGVVKSVLAQVKGLEKATGVQFNYQKILKEVSSLSGVLGLNFSKYPAQLTKSYLTIKAMGMDMKQLESMADSFLDVESSIAKEMEAQVLTGRDINLNKARELFLNNDLAGAAAEINRQVGSSADFLKMNRIAAESFAQSLGMSRDSMADMLQKQELYSKLGAKGTENAREMYQLALKKYGTEKEMAAALGEQAYQSMVQASTQERLMNFIEKIKQSIVDFIERGKIIEKIEAFVKTLTNPNTIKGIIGTIKNAIADFIAFSGELLADVARFVSHLPFTDKDAWQNRADIIQATTAGMAGNIRAMGGDMGGPASISDNAVKAQTAGAGTAAAQPTAQGFSGAQNINNNIVLTMDGRPVASTVQVLNTQSSNIDRNKTINPYPGIYTVG